MKIFYRLLALLPLLAALPVAAQVTTETDTVAAGRRIYLEGILPDGQPLRGVRSDTGVVSGSAAACVACHRPSGLGTVEGTVVIPPISGRALFGGGDPVIVRTDRPFNPGLSIQHPPYDSAAFAAAIRDGRHQSGRAMNALMPRYTLSDGQLQAVAAYLQTLSKVVSPAVVGDTIHMATVIAPGVDAERRKAFVATLTTLVGQMNISLHSKRQKLISVEERRQRSRHKWALDVWELSGPSSTWAEQLERRHRESPVFAIVSGLAKDEWQPVQNFCENNRVGCWFPSVDLVPAGASQSHFSLYFSAGIATEADVMARKLTSTSGRIVQLVAADPVARGGAAALRRALLSSGNGEVVDVDVSVGMAAIKDAVAKLDAHDAIILWLRPADLSRLADLPTTAAQVFVSASLGGGERIELPMALRRQASLVQPLEEPKLRAANVERCVTWSDAMNIAMVDMRMQCEVFFAAGSLQWTLRSMLNNLHTDYLIERAEATLGMFETMQVQEEIGAMMMGPMNKRPLSQTPQTDAETEAMAEQTKAQRAHLEEMSKRGGTTAYPRLTLAPGQRFASKGAYLEKLNPDAPGIIGEPEWVVP